MENLEGEPEPWNETGEGWKYLGMEKRERRELRLRERNVERGMEEIDSEARIDEEEGALMAVEITDLDSEPERQAIFLLLLWLTIGIENAMWLRVYGTQFKPLTMHTAPFETGITIELGCASLIYCTFLFWLAQFASPVSELIIIWEKLA